MHPLLIWHEPQICKDDEPREKTGETIDDRCDNAIPANLNKSSILICNFQAQSYLSHKTPNKISENAISNLIRAIALGL